MTQPTNIQSTAETQEFHHTLPLQIRWNDVDQFGHVNNGVFFQFYDTAKTDYLATACDDVDWGRKAIVVVHIEADFLSEVKAGSHIAARTRISHIGRTSFHLQQDVIDTDTQEVKCRCLSIMVLYDLQKHESIPLPDHWVKSISEFEGVEFKRD